MATAPLMCREQFPAGERCHFTTGSGELILATARGPREPALGEGAVPLLRLVCGGEVGQPWRPGEAPTLQFLPEGRAGSPVTAVQTIAVRGHEVADLRLDGELVGRRFETDDAVWCYLGGVLPAETGVNPADQTRSVFCRLEDLLREAGLAFEDVARTWFYLDGLLEWYADFNAVRTSFLDARRITCNCLPASTGIGAANPHGAALAAGLLALRPKRPRVAFEPVASPLQGPAYAYRSSFSRAVEIRCPTYRQLFISGTASIDREGHSIHQGDVDAQIAATMAVIAAILRSRQMGWDNVTRAIGYCRDFAHWPRFEAWLEARSLSLPVAPADATVCRDELLFELELDAVAPA